MPSKPNPWLPRPNRAGWWDWDPGGNRLFRVLLSAGGATVASDDEYEQVTGHAPSEVMSENYWEGTDTTPEHMPGRWRYVGPTAEQRS